MVKKSEYFKPIHSLRIIDVIIEYTKDPKTINFNLLTFYIILLFIGTSHNFYSIFQLTYNLKFLLQIRVSIIILVIIISYFSKKDLFYILNAVFLGLFMIHYVILFILDEWYLVKDVLYPLMLMPIEFEFIKNLSKKYGKEIIQKIIFSLSLLAIGVLTLYFTGYIS